jgi:hypothetical protein
VTIAERAAHVAAELRERNLLPSTRLAEATVFIAASLEQTEWKGIRELEARLARAEAVCYALENATAVPVVHVNVAKALKTWRDGR